VVARVRALYAANMENGHTMNKTAYLDTLGRAMAGLPPDVQARTLAYYEQRFVDGVTAGRSEEDVGRELDEPRQIAMTLRASIHLRAAEERENNAREDKLRAMESGRAGRHTVRQTGGGLRLAVSALALAVFNLFMLVPALVYSALLFALYACTLAFYLAGIATTASGLAGVNELVLDSPAFIAASGGDASHQVRIDIGGNGIQVHEDAADSAEDGAPPAASDRGGAADGGVRITTGMDAASRATQTLLGGAMIVGAILGFLLLLVVSRYSLAGLRRYLLMNRALLGGQHHA
jgi:uncharacterized membrane protein